MFSPPEQLSAATKASIETRIDILNTVTSKAFEGLEKVINLNLKMVKTSLEESAATAKKLLSSKNPQEFFTLTASQTQPSLEKMLSYGRLLSDISSCMQAEFLQVTQEQFAETQGERKQLSNPAAPKASPSPLGSAAIATETVSLNAKDEQKTSEPINLTEEPAAVEPASTKAEVMPEVKVALELSVPLEQNNPATPLAAAAIINPAAESITAKPSAAIPAITPVAATATEEKTAIKPAIATPVAKPGLSVHQAAPAMPKNKSKKK